MPRLASTASASRAHLRRSSISSAFTCASGRMPATLCKTSSVRDWSLAILEGLERAPLTALSISAPEIAVERAASSSRSNSAGSRRRLLQVNGEDLGAILGRWQVDEHRCEAPLTDLLRSELAHVIGGGDDKHAGMRLGQPAQQRADDAAGGTAVGSGGGTHPADRFFVLGQGLSTHLVVVAICRARLMLTSAEPSRPPPSPMTAPRSSCSSARPRMDDAARAIVILAATR